MSLTGSGQHKPDRGVLGWGTLLRFVSVFPTVQSLSWWTFSWEGGLKRLQPILSMSGAAPPLLHVPMTYIETALA